MLSGVPGEIVLPCPWIFGGLSGGRSELSGGEACEVGLAGRHGGGLVGTQIRSVMVVEIARARDTHMC